MTRAEAEALQGEYAVYDYGGMYEQGGIIGPVIDDTQVFVNYGFFDMPTDLAPLSRIELCDLDLDLMAGWVA